MLPSLSAASAVELVHVDAASTSAFEQHSKPEQPSGSSKQRPTEHMNAEELPSSSGVSVERDPSLDPRFKFCWRKLWKFMGPGFLMSIAYIDPGNLESDLQAGAHTGYVLLWLIVFTTGLGLMVQMQSAKLGVVTGRHLAEHCRAEFPSVPSKALWLMAEVAIIGSDIQEVIGCAIAIVILSQGYIPLWAGVIITTVDSFLLLYIERWGVRYLEAFFAVLIGVMAVTFGIMYEKADVPFSDVAGGLFVPTLPRYAVPTAVALMGSLIMPHNIYLHSALVQTRGLSTQSATHKREALVYFGIESALSLLVAVLINLFVVAVFANGFFGKDSAEGIGLQNAGEYLGDRYGSAVKYIWALGLLAAGQSSTMTGTYTGQFVMGGYLNLKVSPWLRVVITRGVAICPTLLIAVIYRNVDSELDVVNQSLNLLQSVQLPFALIPVLTFASSRRIMGEFKNAWYTSAATWATAVIVMIINVIGVFDVLSTAIMARGWWAGALCAAIVTIYFVFIAYLIVGPTRFDTLLMRMGRKRNTHPVPKDGHTCLLEQEPSSSLLSGSLDPVAALPARQGMSGVNGSYVALPSGEDDREPEEAARRSEEGGQAHEGQGAVSRLLTAALDGAGPPLGSQEAGGAGPRAATR